VLLVKKKKKKEEEGLARKKKDTKISAGKVKKKKKKKHTGESPFFVGESKLQSPQKKRLYHQGGKGRQPGAGFQRKLKERPGAVYSPWA